MVVSPGLALEAIRAIARTRKTGDLAALCAEMQDIAASSTASDRVAIYLVDRPTNELVMAAVPFGYDGDAAREYHRRPVDGPMMGMVTSTLQPAFFSAALLPDPFREVAESAGFVEFAIIPLHAEGVLSGTINLARTQPNPYSQETIDLAMMLGEQISVQIERARLLFIEKERVAKLASLNDDLRRSYEELSRTQDELIRKEKLANLGELAMIVAHEVRNPLGVVFNVISQLRKSLESEPDGAALVRILEEEASRLDRVVKDFLDFGRPTIPQLRGVDVAALVSSAIELTNHLLTSTAMTWKVALDDDVGEVQADEHLLRGALVNVLLNAAEVPSTSGTVWIRAKGLEIDGQRHVQLAIEDDGPAEAPLSDKVFDPFFTTKAFGTGLGLTIVKRTVEAHKGAVRLESREGKGTVLTIVLPVGTDAPEPEAR